MAPMGRMVLQLLALGYLLVPIFRTSHCWLVLLFMAFMLGVATLEAVQRPASSYPVRAVGRRLTGGPDPAAPASGYSYAWILAYALLQPGALKGTPAARRVERHSWADWQNV